MNLIIPDVKDSHLAPASRTRNLLQRAKQLQGRIEALLQLCQCIDSTGSMYPVFVEAQSAVKRIIEEVSSAEINAEMAFIAYKNHGDERYFDGERAFVATPLTKDPATILSLMQKVSNGGGGDGLTALEDVLDYVVRDMEWKDSAAKALVIVGDMPPHGVVDSIKHCPRKIDYRQAISGLKRLGIKVYAVYCDTDHHQQMGRERKSAIQDFYHAIADETGGQYLTLEDIPSLITILLGICFKSVNRMDDLVEKLRKTNQLGPREQKIIRALGPG